MNRSKFVNRRVHDAMYIFFHSEVPSDTQYLMEHTVKPLIYVAP